MKQVVPIHEKYLLSISECCLYFNLGENKMRKIVEEHQGAEWIFRNGQRLLIKRKMFEKVIDEIDTI